VIEKPADLADRLYAVLAEALHRTWIEVPKISSLQNGEWSIRVRDAWIRSLRCSFRRRYLDGSSAARRFAVFGGKPAHGTSPTEVRKGVPSGVREWRMWEFLHDITVVQLGTSSAPYNKGDVTFAERAVWQVESEVAGNGTEVAKDLSKLRVGAADHKLFIARRVKRTKQHDPQRWLDFIGRMATGIEGDLFLGLMPTYSSAEQERDEAQLWRDCKATITLYRCPIDGSAPQRISEICSNSLNG
jgi:hypothetical protein